MPRVKRGTQHVKRRKRLLKQAKGFRWRRKSSIKQARTAVIKAGVHAYRDRRKRKRVFRQLWQTQLNAALRQQGWTYSTFIGALHKAKIELDRKVLADLAINEPKIFSQLLKQLK